MNRLLQECTGTQCTNFTATSWADTGDGKGVGAGGGGGVTIHPGTFTDGKTQIYSCYFHFNSPVPFENILIYPYTSLWARKFIRQRQVEKLLGSHDVFTTIFVTWEMGSIYFPYCLMYHHLLCIFLGVQTPVKLGAYYWICYCAWSAKDNFMLLSVGGIVYIQMSE